MTDDSPARRLRPREAMRLLMAQGPVLQIGERAVG